MSLTRDTGEDEDENGFDAEELVVAPFYPFKKMVNWWLVVGDEEKRQLLAVKKVTFKKSLNVRMQFTLPKGEYTGLKLSVYCDSYLLDADQRIELGRVVVGEAEESDEDEDEDEDEEMEG